MTEAVAIRLEAATKHYRTAAGLVRAVDGIDAVIESGTSVAIVGPSGCGKSSRCGHATVAKTSASSSSRTISSRS